MVKVHAINSLATDKLRIMSTNDIATRETHH